MSKNVLNKELCDCGKVATWWYAPATDRDFGNRYFCDEHVHRGCDCQIRHVSVDAYHPPLDEPDMPTDQDRPWIWIEENISWAHVDAFGRQYPCVEYWHDEDGFERTFN